MPVKQSVCYPIMAPLPVPLEEFFRHVAEIGFAAVEIWKPDDSFPQVSELARRNNLVLASFGGHDSLGNGLNNPTEHDRIESELRASIDLAARHQVPGIICFSGNILPDLTEEQAIENCANGLRRVAPYAEEKGVNLNLELLNSKVDHPGYQCDYSAWGIEVVERVNSPRVKVLYDIYHMQIMEGNLIQTITDHIDSIGHFHTAGVPGRFDIDDTQEINYTGVCRAIAGAGYDLYVGHEFKPKGDVFESLKKAYEICSQP